MTEREAMFYPELAKDDSLALHTDLYEINMMYTYFKKGIADRNTVFESFYRKEPFGNGYAVYAGLEHIINYLKNLKFTESDLQYLKENEGYDDDFIDYLRNLKLKLTIRSMKEGELVFANEPILQVEGPIAASRPSMLQADYHHPRYADEYADHLIFSQLLKAILVL